MRHDTQNKNKDYLAPSTLGSVPISAPDRVCFGDDSGSSAMTTLESGLCRCVSLPLLDTTGTVGAADPELLSATFLWRANFSWKLSFSGLTIEEGFSGTFGGAGDRDEEYTLTRQNFSPSGDHYYLIFFSLDLALVHGEPSVRLRQKSLLSEFCLLMAVCWISLLAAHQILPLPSLPQGLQKLHHCY